MSQLFRSEILDNLKKKDQEKEPQISNYQQQLVKPVDKPLHSAEVSNANVPVTQHVPAQQLLSPTHTLGQSGQQKEDSKEKSIKVANSTTITLIENGNLNGDKDKDNTYKNYFTLEPKNEKKDDCNKNSITITKTALKQSPGGSQGDKKAQIKPAKRPLQYLETLAEKAGITFEDKYEAANTLLALDKQNSTNRRLPDLKAPKSEPDNHNQQEEYRYRNQKEEDDKLQPVHTQFNLPGIGEINLSFLASPQSNVNLLFDKNQKTMSGDIKPQQIVDGQTQVVQQQMSMSQHEPSQQHHQTVTVVSSMPSSMATHQVQQQQTGGGIQQQAGSISTMPPLQSLPPNTQHPQQISAEWGHSRVQVIQQPLQNSTYLQQLYNAQGPLLMPSNIALHPGINSQQIQVIAAGKPFQGNQLTPHMLTTQGKQVLQGQAAPFPGYTTIPAIPTTQNQTFVFSPLGVINSQPSILPAHSQSTVSAIGQQQKQSDMHKCGAKGASSKAGGSGVTQTVPVQAQCVQVSQPVLGTQQPTQAQIISPLQTGGQTMQFAPWQISGALPQVWAGGLQAGTLPAGGLLAPNPIFIRGTQPDAPPSMFIQHSPQNNVQHTSVSVACATSTTSKPRASSDGLAKAPRPLSNILPSSGIRPGPGSSVSTQTNPNQPQNQMTQITSVDKAKNIQQQALLQQQALQQQTQQMVHYQQQGMSLGMQQGTVPVGSVAQTLPMAGMPQTISMVQQIHPLSGMGQPGTLVSQLSTSQPQSVQTLQQPQTLVGGGLVQTSVGMTVQQQAALNHSASMQTLTLQAAQGTVGLIAAPVQGSVLPLQTPATLVTHVKTEDEKPQISSTPRRRVQAPVLQIQPTQQVVPETSDATSTTFSSSVTTTADASVSTSTATIGAVTPMETTKSTPTKAESHSTTAEPSSASTTPAASSSAPVPSSAQQTTPVAPQVVTTVASSTSSSSTMTAAITAPVTSGGTSSALFKSTQCTPRHMSQQAAHDKGLPKAMVKPNILTHVIEGYVIQEAGEPFAVNRPLRDWVDKEQDKENKLPTDEGPPRKKQMLEHHASSVARISSSNETASHSSAPAHSNTKTRHEEAAASSTAETASASSDTTQAPKIPNANKWTVSEVCDFIRNIPGCAGYADEFLMQEVDGEALLLIRPGAPCDGSVHEARSRPQDRRLHRLPPPRERAIFS
ncbi:hypothetical protein HW555_003789 [Spodoptera exigua]|uniref:Polyhomeotic-proximal chromatin protein-like n=1 Tax=Spodoptera exigua TaxID=7107 RepID=A0A835GMR5_SPOEX|nr:hypothetical protein HW555_003789 [Spodoptera exigua]